MIDDLRLQPQMTTALEVAILVKRLPNLQEAAELIEAYAMAVAAGARADATIERIEKTFGGKVDA